jgi:glycosyltransferase involved in cell wall biosynthesis
MRIMFCMMTLSKGGAERVVNILSNQLSYDNEIKIVTQLNSDIAYKFNKKVIIKNLTNNTYSNNSIKKIFNKISIKSILNLKQEIINFSPDVIISFLPEPSFKVLILKKFFIKMKNIPIIVSVRNDPVIEYNNFVYKVLMKKLYKIANYLVLQTQDSKSYFDNIFTVKNSVIYNPVSTEFLVEKYTGERDKRFVAVGRLEKQKNYQLMIDAFEMFCKKFDDFILEIYGEGTFKEKIKKYIRDKNMEDKIYLKGKIDSVSDVLYKAKGFLMSSDYEGMPNSLLEAACMGVPCVSTDCPCGGPREILDNGRSGILVPVGDVERFYEGIEEIVLNECKSEEMSKNANSNRSRYSQDIIIKEWIDIIKEITKSK